MILSVPGAPGTKPSACDFGLKHATGEYTVIYDSEDSPDPLMLLKAVRDFRVAAPSVACLQARLLFWNILPGQMRSRDWLAGLVTRMYFVEYVVHFEFVLRGMARLSLVPPLGGTSNIFMTEVLREIAISTSDLVAGGIPQEVAEQMVAAWDPWCVAEDADIARGWPGTATRSRWSPTPGRWRRPRAASSRRRASGRAGARGMPRPARCSPATRYGRCGRWGCGRWSPTR